MSERVLPPYRVVVGLPTHDHVPAGFAYDLAMMSAYTGIKASTYGIEYRQRIVFGTLIDSMREGIVSGAFEDGSEFTHVLFLDTDMRFPKTLLLHLLARKLPIVGANYSTRRAPHQPTAFKTLGRMEPQEDGTLKEIPHEHLWFDEANPELVEVQSMGMGACLIAREVFEKVPRPWFKVVSGMTPDGRYVNTGEDVYFCHKARQAGFAPTIDTTLDRLIGHVGTFTYRLEESTALHEAITAQQAARETLIVGPDGKPASAEAPKIVSPE